MTTKDTLHHIIEGLSEQEAEDLLDWLNLQADPDTLSEEEERLVEEGRQAIARGDSVQYESIDQLRRELGLDK